MRVRPPHDEHADEGPSRPFSLPSLLPLLAAAVFFVLGLSGLAGLLPFVDSSFVPSATPAPGALGRNPQPLATQAGAPGSEALPDFSPILDMLRAPFALPTPFPTEAPDVAAVSLGSGSVRAVLPVEPTATPVPPTAVPTATEAPTQVPTSEPEPTATATPDFVVPDTSPGGSSTYKPEVALYDPNAVATVAPDSNFSGYQTLPPPQDSGKDEEHDHHD